MVQYSRTAIKYSSTTYSATISPLPLVNDCWLILHPPVRLCDWTIMVFSRVFHSSRPSISSQLFIFFVIAASPFQRIKTLRRSGILESTSVFCFMGHCHFFLNYYEIRTWFTPEPIKVLDLTNHIVTWSGIKGNTWRILQNRSRSRINMTMQVLGFVNTKLMTACCNNRINTSCNVNSSLYPKWTSYVTVDKVDQVKQLIAGVSDLIVSSRLVDNFTWTSR